MALGGIEFQELLDVRLSFVFSATHHSRSAAVKFDERLTRREVPGIQVHGYFKLFVSFFGQGNRRKPSRAVCFLAVSPAKPFVVDGTPWVERDGFLRAANGGVVFLYFQIALCQEQLNVAVGGFFGGCGLQRLDGLSVFARLKSTSRFIQAVVVLDG